MEQVKIFSGIKDDVQTKVNEWFKDNKSVEIISRQFQAGDNVKSFSIAIFYKG